MLETQPLMSHSTRKAIFLVCFVVVYAIRFYYAYCSKNNQITDNRRTALEKTLIFLTFIGMLVVPLIAVFTPWLAFASYDPPEWTGWSGVIVFAFAIWLFWRSHTDLGQNWSISLEIREEHSLVDTGVYHSIRHPMYAAIWLWGIAQSLLIPNWIGGLSNLMSFLPMYILRVEREEQMMLDMFGEKYRDYMGCTGRIIPRIRKGFVSF